MKRRQALAAILASIALVSLTSCAMEKNQSPETETQTEETLSSVTEDSYLTQIQYYMQTVESLQNELTSVKESSYLSQTEYKLKIKELEESIKSLNDQLEAQKEEQTTQNTPQKPQNTPSDMDNLSQDGTSSVDKSENAQDPQKSYFEYKISDGAASIISFTGNAENLSIPETINGYPVRSIGEGAFRSSQVKSIKIPEGITAIDWFAFEGCTSLSSIDLPASLTSIGYGAFERCSKALIIICKKGSYAEAYAASWGMQYLAK